MPNLFLIGYMGAGKTTIGKLLADKLNLLFIDMDVFIENRFRKSVSMIFKERGEDGFRKIEKMVLEEVAGFENVIISTGGGTPCFFENMELMNQSGLTVYLKVSPEELAKRLYKCKQPRPLIKDKSLDELKVFVEENLKLREPYYMRSAIVIDGEKLTTAKDSEARVNDVISFLPESVFN